MPVEEACVSPVDLGDEELVIPNLRELAGVAERISSVV